ncbi:MAG TPA: hypothetical protein PKN86_05525 [Candidatus Obscuribacter sp.]|nr:hypothetical protein [Candidatus Obscuribacter sp.]HMY53504.1 hypothetical protein [Candidatus Obscuribacter sp.]HND69717.1 hypothetical protein [Candidatus Obscuribacter sp.]HNM49138.1 hypothetical protein [Candidatus Obscuribacter sp.]
MFQVSEGGVFQVFISLTKRTQIAGLCESLQGYLEQSGLDRVRVLSPGHSFILPLQSGFLWMGYPGQPKVSRLEISTDTAINFFMAEISRFSLCPDQLSKVLDQKLVCLDSSPLGLSDVQSTDQVDVQTRSCDSAIFMVVPDELQEEKSPGAVNEGDLDEEDYPLGELGLGPAEPQEVISPSAGQSENSALLGAQSDAEALGSLDSFLPPRVDTPGNVHADDQLPVQDKAQEPYYFGALKGLDILAALGDELPSQVPNAPLENESGFSDLFDCLNLVGDNAQVLSDDRPDQATSEPNSTIHESAPQSKLVPDGQALHLAEPDSGSQDILQLTFPFTNVVSLPLDKPAGSGKKRAPPCG